ncbi:putative short-chain dehydrogenase/reductase family protein [Durotheca rogersii]|uniref:putative short-chain dehydrogenase/reductase family protein n=1 Tax=Durotheca rogersii TaxID=419775 RepID=UPI00221FD15E|nr:putative short-chain dehydrogenase/reductase family protein [Durotheca rogersii]KAI5854490.1 putative short-chain dehydrogenase/reductase family protein [Durotheca rogersii]
MSSELESQAWFESTFIGFLFRQFATPKPLPPGIRLTDQVAVVTGSNVGIGFEASRHLLSLGLSHLIMGVRSQSKGESAAAQLRKEFPAAAVSVWILDMQSYDSVRAFVDECATLPRLDAVILNAALMNISYRTAATTGHELTMQVNYLSTALLTTLLLPVLKAKKIPGAPRPPVICVVGSDLAYRVDVETRGSLLQHFNTPEGFGQFLWYGRSKVLLTFFLTKLAEFVNPDDVLVNMPNPGTTRGTAFFREFSTLVTKIIAIGQFLIARPAATAATTYLDAALVRGKESHGCFVSDWAIKPYPQFWYTAEGKEFGEKLWEETMEELNFAGASKVIQDMSASR